jgi:monoamine oxidase
MIQTTETTLSKPSLPSKVDVVVIGAGAAGLGAAKRLSEAHPPVAFVVLEARARVGGRAVTLKGRSGAAIDLGAGWLHSADQNPWVGVAEDLGFTVDQSPPPWMRPALDVNFSRSDQADYRRAFQAFEDKLEAAAAKPDRTAAELMDPADARWAPLLNAFSGYYNGAPFTDISVHDYAAYQPTDENWRLREGYGALMAAFATPFPILFDAPVRVIDRRGPRLRIISPAGEVEADAVIVTVPTGVLADGALAFDPPLRDKQAAADALPLGHVDKAFLKIATPDALPIDIHLFGRTDSADTGSYTLRPLGNPVIEGFFGGDLAAALEGEPDGAFAAFAIDEITNILGSNVRRALTPIAESRWGRDPYAMGAYSHAKPGQAGARAILAAPVEDRIFFAGEACSAHAFSTAHGAFETGVDAAERVIVGLGRVPPG